MSDKDSSDEFDELHDIIAEYEEKAKEKQLATIKQEPDNNKEGTATIKEEPPLKRIKKEKKQKKPKNLSGEVPMDKVLFGDKKGLLKNLAKAVGKEESSDEESKKEKIRTNEVEENAANEKKRKPAWTDADDEEIQFGDVKRETRFTGPIDHIRKDKSYKEYLATRFSKIMPQPKWATLDKKSKAENSDDEDGLLRTVGFLAKPSADVLQPTQLYFKQLKDLNRSTFLELGITGIEFHPTSTAALVTSYNGKASIYSIDGDINEKLHTIDFSKFSILSARILPCGTKAVLGSKTRFYYKYDLLTTKEIFCPIARDLNCTSCHLEVSPCGRYMVLLGRDGEFHLYNINSNELLHTFKQNHQAVDICFTADSERIICKDDSANVNIFSMRQRRLQHSFIDDGCVKGTVLTLSPDQRMLATGSREGVVNVYDFEKVQKEKTPKPEKRFLNLRTGISAIKFNHSSELLAMCSHRVPNSVKIAHFPSATVYKNFPIAQPDLGNIMTLKFSPNSGYLALGNSNRRVPLFRLKHFNNY